MEKAKETTQPTFRTTTLHRATQSSRVRTAVRPSSPQGFIWGILGWLCAAAVLGGLIAALNHQRMARAAVVAQLAPGLQKIRGSVDARQEQLETSQQVLAKAVNDQIKRQEDLTLQVKGLELSIRELDPQVKTLERTEDRLRGELAALQENRTVTVQGVEALEEELAELESVRDRLSAVYRRRFLNMKAAYERARTDRDPVVLERFFRQHRHTVFAPAAGFDAADKHDAAGRTEDALRLYREVMTQFPGSLYAARSETRVGEIKAGDPYRAPEQPIPFEPYRPHLRSPE